MILLLTIIAIIGLSIILLSSYLAYIIQDTIRIKREVKDDYNKEDVEELLNVMSVSHSLFRISYIIGFVLILGGIGMMTYKIFC